ncbi:MAG TPA: hypothetical protein DEO60_15905 [Bacteroidales bacterium]|jgi:hypothetical protein|nr:hypothetical protein [Bacteroidales bacterium]HBZ22618.1 hypothetical protein [Bacteroidales bacterium]
MKKILLLLVVLSFSLVQLKAQEPTFVKGDKALNLGIGLGSTLYSGTYYKASVPPVSASLEVGVADNILEKGVIGVGGYLGFSSYKYEYSNSGWKTSNIIVGARGNFHYPLVEKLDTYTGLLLGYSILSHKYFGIYGDEDYSGSSSGLQWAWFVGGRYYFKENFAAMLELGYGVAYLNLGIALKF